MSWFQGLKPDSLRDAFVHEIKKAYDMEERQIEALEDFGAEAADADLRGLFARHLDETRAQLARIEEICGQLGEEVEGDRDTSAAGAAKDAKLAVAMGGDPATRDACLILAAQRAEHLEIASYGTLRTWARMLGLHEVAGLIERSLAEERAFDQQLTELAESAINVSAAH